MDVNISLVENWYILVKKCYNTKDRYLVNLDLYQGQNPHENEKYNSIFGKAVSPLIIMLAGLPSSKNNLPYSLHMDNLFTRLNVFNYLKCMGYSAIGTIRQNSAEKLPFDWQEKIFEKRM